MRPMYFAIARRRTDPFFRNTLCALLYACIGYAAAAGADTVHLKSGIAKEGLVVSQDENEVVLEISRRGLKARIRIPAADVERIEKTRSAGEEYAERVKTISANDARAWLELGTWCESRRLKDEAHECYRKALAIKPDLAEAGEKLGLVNVQGQWLKTDQITAKADGLIAAGKFKEAAATLEPLRQASIRLLPAKRREILSRLCRCYELAGAWPLAQETYEALVKAHGSLTPEVAVVRVKQRLLQQHPDGLIPPPPGLEPKPAEAQKPDLVKAVGDGVKAVADLVAQKPGPRVSLADPKVMDAAIRHAAENILRESDDLVRKADAQALSEKLLRAANPLEHLQRLLDAIPNLMRMGTGQARPITFGPADETYARAADRALEADFLVRDISKPIRLAIARKRLALIDDWIARARQDLETNSLYIPPPAPNAPPDPNLRARLLQLSPDKDRADRFRMAVENLDKLYVLKFTLLNPMSDDFVAEIQKNEKDREGIEDTRKKAQTLSALSEDLKQCAKLETESQQSWVKAQTSHPSRFPYSYDLFLSPDGLYHFRDKGKFWRSNSDQCINHCDDAMSSARKRKAILSKYPERPQTAGELASINSFIVQVYNYRVGIQAQYNKKGGAR